MNKYLPIIIFIILTTNKSIGQQAIDWTTYFGSTNEDYVNQYYDHVMAKDNNGNIIVAGYTNSTSGISNNGFQNQYGGGAYDAYLVKFNSSGALLWSTYFGGNGNDQAYAVSTDNSGNIYLVGFTGSTSNIAQNGFQNTYGGGSNDAFIVKFNSNGNRIWSSYFGGESDDPAWGVTTDLNGNILMCGNTVSNNSISSNGFQNMTSGGGDAYLVKFDSSGNRIWSTYYGGMASEYGTSVITDSSNNIYLCGYTNSTSLISSLGFQNTLAGNQDAFLVKFNPSGSRVWGTYFGGTASDFGSSLSTDGSNIYFSGYTNSTSNIAINGFQNGFGGGVFDAFITKFSNSGSLSWSSYFGGQGEEYGIVSNDNSGNVILSGHTNSLDNIANGGFQNTIGGQNDLYFSIFDINGNQICSSYFGGINNEWGGHTISDNNKLYLVGHTNTVSGFVGGGFQSTYNGGSADLILAKVNSCAITCSTTYSTTNLTHCGDYNWNSNIFSVSGTYYDTIVNVNGCDSILTLNLTIVNVDTSTTIQDGIISSSVPDAIYSWFDCSDNTVISNQNNQFYAPQISGSYALIISQNGCVDTSACIIIDNVGTLELVSQKDTEIFPNPFSNKADLIFPSGLEVINLYLFNQFGELLFEIKNHANQKTSIFRNNLPCGVYILEISSGTYNEKRRMVILD